MFKLFLKSENEIKYPIKKYSKFDYIAGRYQNELAKIKEYYYNKDRAVNNSHMISRLISIMLPSLDYDVYDYLKSVEATAKLVSKQFGIVSNINKGKVHDNVLYGKNSKEVFLYTENEINLETFTDDWRDYAGVRVIYTTNTNLDMKIPFNDDDRIIPELTVMEIDIVTIMMQYREWYYIRTVLDQSTNINIFVAQVVLVNTLDNMLDLAVWNRFIAINEGISIPSFKRAHPFAVIDYTPGVDTVLKEVLKDMAGTTSPIEQIIDTVPSIVSSDMRKVLYISHKYYTVQSKWALWASRVSYISNIVRILSSKGIRRNGDHLNRLPVLVKKLERDKAMDNVLGEYLYNDFIYDVEELGNTLGKR